MSVYKFAVRGATFALLLSSTVLLSAKEEEPKVIEIHSEKFDYLPAEITLKKGETYKLHLTSNDVPHSFRIKALQVNGAMKPNEFTDVLFTPDQVGDFRADCGVYCGAGHSKMGMTVHVVEN